MKLKQKNEKIFVYEKTKVNPLRKKCGVKKNENCLIKACATVLKRKH